MKLLYYTVTKITRSLTFWINKTDKIKKRLRVDMTKFDEESGYCNLVKF